MALESLLEVLEPPTVPIEANNEHNWSEIEETLGVQLPSDYKEFITVFGTGAIGHLLWVFNPFSGNENLNLLQQLKSRTEILRHCRSSVPDELQYAVYPETGGLLPWGVTDYGDQLLWLPTDSADEWVVVVKEIRGPGVEEYSCGLSEFLRGLVTGDIESAIIPRELLDLNRLFVPLGSQSYEQK